MSKKVFVSGCYDMLHSGHFAFFEEASQFGDLYVGIGSDDTIMKLKGRPTVNPESERLYMIQSLKFVKQAFINSGSGIIDFEGEIKNIKPDILFVNEDGHSNLKEELCRKYRMQYIISRRIPKGQLPTRSTTMLRQECTIPYRIDLAGGWLDQPYVSKHHPGSVITISIEPEIDFNDRSGMSTSTRYKAIELWQNQVPEGDREKLAKTLFCYENPPGSEFVSGSQDALGIVMPGLNKYYYDGDYWPVNIKSTRDEKMLSWLEDHIYLVALGPRSGSFDVLDNTVLNKENSRNLANATEQVWESIHNLDLQGFAKGFTQSFEAQIKMFPNMVNDEILETIDTYKDKAMGWKLSGAGGGGYIILISDKPVENSLKIKIRR
ncbi:MAG: adenylyltransferase/cytidyltransferase family protein [Bacteroidota bacterium]